jgi:peptidoglycan/xylan/chitin deacetylase (PgdA/CDA1 family)
MINLDALDKYLHWRFNLKIKIDENHITIVSTDDNSFVKYVNFDALERLNYKLLNPKDKNNERIYTADLDLSFECELEKEIIDHFENIKNRALFKRIIISHDIDLLRLNYQYFTWPISILASRRYDAFFKLILTFFKSIFTLKSPANNLEIWMELEKKFGVKAVYFFLWQRISTGDLIHRVILSLGSYSFKKKKIRSKIQEVKNAGFEIGLHGSYGSSTRGEYFQKEIEELRAITKEKIISHRFHYLDFSRWGSTNLLERDGIAIDSSIGFRPPVINTPTGSLFPTLLPNSDSKTLSDIIHVVPLLMDDCFDSNFKIKIDNLFRQIVSYDFVFSIIVHNTANLRNPFAVDAFEYFITRAQSLDINFCDFKDLENHFNC